MARDLLIFGAGGHAAKVVEVARSLGINVLGYVSTEPSGSLINGLRVLTDLAEYAGRRDLEEAATHIAIGEPFIRHRIDSELKPLRRELLSIVSDQSYRGAGTSVGEGSCVMALAALQSRARIGRCSIVDTGAIVEHDSRIGDFVNVSPGAVLCGGVTIGDGAIIGAGAVVIEKITVGANALLGAGAIVLRDVPNNAVVTGNPARIIRERSFDERYLK